ncbi:hypothetical protein HPQ64_16075 [Rhizobiales bacterium]|uniref:hypothetical protein n=1 Tax=Hongsoonwoonella zoysiae TaxID=2821844 RepID=UPI0015610586|nr:hypothetical protein [Hongsoonwoonella zoysiae]NRG19209.1 hypothetical protein [Hongsoonwoonella zoysiae]
MRMIALVLGVFGAGFAIMLFFSSGIDRSLSLASVDGLVEKAASAFTAQPAEEGGGMLAWFGFGGNPEPKVMHLDKIVVSEGPEACRINPASSEDRVVFVNLHRAEGKSPVQISDGTGKLTSMVNVNLGRYQSPIYLVLHAYDSVFWQLNVLNGTEISNILLIGDNSQAVANVPPGVFPQIISGKNENNRRCPDFAVAGQFADDPSELENKIRTTVKAPISESKFVYAAKDLFLGADSKSLSRPSLIDGRKIYTHNKLTQGGAAPGGA